MPDGSPAGLAFHGPFIDLANILLKNQEVTMESEGVLSRGVAGSIIKTMPCVIEAARRAVVASKLRETSEPSFKRIMAASIMEDVTRGALSEPEQGRL